MAGMARDVSDDNPLTPEEALDSDEVRNDDGDEVVDPPEKWIEPPKRTRRSTSAWPTRCPTWAPTTSTRATPTTPPGRPVSMSDDELDRLDPAQHGTERGQIDGTPEDGDSFFDVER